MRKPLLFLVILFLPCIIHSADVVIVKEPVIVELIVVDVIVNGKIGKVIADKVVSDTEFYKPSVIGIDDSIMRGRAIISAHRKMKVSSYKTEMTHEDRVVTNVTRLMKMREKLQKLGFINEADLTTQSIAADIKAGVNEKDRWQ